MRRAFTIGALILYPFWGMISSALLFSTSVFHDLLLFSIVGVLFAGLLPVALHLFEVRFLREAFSWGTMVASLTFGGMVTLFLGSLLQVVLLWCGIHSFLGLPLDSWGWRFPDWMFQTP
jgi:hypothetical protein